MKKVTFFILMIAGALLCSCGTSANYASSDSWEDGIYYRRSMKNTQEIFTENKEVEELVQKTKDEAKRYTETIIISENQHLSEITIDSTASGSYNINLNFYEDPWYDSYYSYNNWVYWGPSWSLYWDPFWYPSYWGPYWGFSYGYYGFYGYGYYGWYDPWYNPWFYYPVYPPYPYYPQYAVNDGPVVYGKRDATRNSSLSSSHRGNLLTSNKELREHSSTPHHSAVDRSANNRNIRTRDLALKADKRDNRGSEIQGNIGSRKANDKFLSSGENNRGKGSAIKGNFRKSDASRSIDNESFRSNVSRDFRNTATRESRSTSTTVRESNQRSSTYSGNYNRSGSFGSGSGSVRNSGGGVSGGGGRARR